MTINDIAKISHFENFDYYKILQQTLFSGGAEFCKPLDEFLIIFYKDSRIIGKINCSNELICMLTE